MIAGAVLTFLAQFFLARLLGPSHFGSIAVALATIGIISPLTTFGVAQLWMLLFGTERRAANRWIPPSFRFVGCCSTVAILILIAWTFLAAHSGAERRLNIVLVPALISYGCLELVSAKFRIENSFGKLAAWLMLLPLGRAIAVATLYAVGSRSTLATAFAYAAVGGVCIAASMPTLARVFRGGLSVPEVPSPKILGPVGVKSVMRASWPFGVEVLLYPLYFQSCLLVLSLIRNDEQVGLFSVATTILAGVYLMPDTLYQKYFLPKLHYWAVHDRQKFLRTYLRVGTGVIFIGSIVALALCLAANPLVHRLYGPEYARAASYLTILSLCVPIRFTATAIGVALFSEHKAHARVIGFLAATCLAVLGTAIFETRAPGYGAAIGMVLGEVTLLVFFAIAASHILVEAVVESRRNRRVCVVGYYGMQNFGDDLFMSVLSRELGGTACRGEVVFSCPRVEGVNARFTYSSLVTTAAYAWPGVGRLLRGASFAAAVLSARRIVLGGGSVIDGRLSARSIALWLLSRARVIELSALGVSVGPFRSDLEIARAKRLLDQCRVVHVRDSRSVELLRLMRVRAEVVAGDDLAALISTARSVVGPHAQVEILYVPCKVHLDGVDDVAVNLEIASAIAAVARKGSSRVTVAALNSHPALGDCHLAADAVRLLKEAGVNCELLDYADIGPEEVLDKMRSIDLCVSTRLHGAIPSYVLGARVLMIGYHKKCEDFARAAGFLECQYVDIGEVTSNRVRDNLFELIAASTVQAVSPAEYCYRARTSFDRAVALL